MNEPIPAETVPAAASARPGFLGRLRNRVAALSRSRHAHAAMIGVSVIDGSVFPVPPFALLVPMVLAEPKKWLRYAVSGTLASLLGGLIGYTLGHMGGEAIASTLGITTDIAIKSTRLGVDTTLGKALTDNFWMLALLCSILPTPYKVVAIGSGLVGVGLPEFLLASILGRSARFFGVAGAFAFFGEKARRFIKV